LALAVNVRPVYLASVLPVGGLLLLGFSRPVWLPRLLLFGVGATLILTPQWLINRRHFGASSPLVLSQSKELHIHNLYLQKLWYGLIHEKYESSVGRELPTGQLLFLDAQGDAVLKTEQVAEFSSFSEYLRTVARHPFTVAGVYARHLFAGLDISHPTPYLRRWSPSIWLQFLNYTIWCWAALVALNSRPTLRTMLTLAGLLLPCLAVLPMSMEVRFLLPLHLLLLALVAFGRFPVWAFRGRYWLALPGCYSLALVCCFGLSNHIKQMVEPRFRPFLLLAEHGTGPVPHM
jgi:hypothetical protein